MMAETIYNPMTWTKDEVAQLLDLIDKGFSQKEISLKIGRSVASIANKLKRIKKDV